MGVKSVIKSIIKGKKTILPIEKPIPESKMLSGKVALISGGSGGIGMAIAKSLQECGCFVIIGGTNSNKLDKCKNNLIESLTKTVVLNLNEISTFSQVIEDAHNMYGKIDIFVNSAGIHTKDVNIWTMTPDEYDNVMNINLKGVYFFSIEMAKYWKKNQMKGHILLISSNRGSEPAWSPYGISKWGINGMTKGLAKLLLPDEIIVNAISPGATATPLLGVGEGESIYCEDNNLHRMITPEEVGAYARMLVSDIGDMLVGETIHISGGRGVFDIR